MELKAYEILKDKLGEERAAIILGFVEGKIGQVQGKINEQKEACLTKDDKLEMIRATKEDKMELIKIMKEDKMELIQAWKNDKMELIQSWKNDKLELIKNIKDDKMELIKIIKEDKVDLIKWMVGFWITQVAAIIGLYLKK
jgi:hypothetical protein